MGKNNFNSDKQYNKELDLSKLGDYEDTFNCFKKALDIEPEDKIVQENKVIVLRVLK